MFQGKSTVRSKLQTNLNQFSFKSTKRQLKHDKNNSDNEVSSTQDHIFNYNYHPSSVCSEKSRNVENKISTNATLELKNSTMEKRMKIDMEYKWYIEKNIEISPEDDRHQIISKISPNISVFDNKIIKSKTCKNSYSHSSKPESVHNCKPIASKSNINILETRVFDLQEDKIISLNQNKNLNKLPNINSNRKNDSNFHEISPEIHNFKTVHDSNQHITNYRKPIQLSPRQFFKYKKCKSKKSNSSRISYRNFSPLFIPLFNKSNKCENISDDEKTTETTSRMEAVWFKNDILNSQPNITKENNLFHEKNNEQTMKTQKDSEYYFSTIYFHLAFFFIH